MKGKGDQNNRIETGIMKNLKRKLPNGERKKKKKGNGKRVRTEVIWQLEGCWFLSEDVEKVQWNFCGSQHTNVVEDVRNGRSWKEKMKSSRLEALRVFKEDELMSRTALSNRNAKPTRNFMFFGKHL